MNESKITASHLRRTAVIYVRQFSLTQVDRNKESTARHTTWSPARKRWAGRRRRSA
jgi:hypothetical protein